MTDQLRDKFNALRLAAAMKERDQQLAVSAVEKARRAEEAARDAALDAVVRAFKDELVDAVALLADAGVAASIGEGGTALVVGARTLCVRRVGTAVVIEENGRPAGMLEYRKANAGDKEGTPKPGAAKDSAAKDSAAKDGAAKEQGLALRYLDGKPFEGVPERLALYLDRLVSELLQP